MAKLHSPLLSRSLMPPRSGQQGYGTQSSSKYGVTDVRASSRRLNSKDNAGEDGDTLRPESSGEPDSEVEKNKFAYSPGQLDKLFNPKNFDAFGTNPYSHQRHYQCVTRLR